MNEPEFVTLKLEAHAARIALRRPPLNFLSMSLLRQFEQCLDRLGDSPACNALVIDSDIPAFSAGVDMSEHNRETVFLLLEQYHAVARTLSSFPRPTIAVARGVALGAGNELIACCDFVLASDKATFGQPEIKVGAIPSLAPLLLPEVIGQRRALQMMLTGELIDAGEAERIGLIHKAVPEDRLSAEVDGLVAKLAGLSRAVLEVALQTARMVRRKRFEELLRDIESLYLNQLMDLEDALEGIRAFLEKRPPLWKNR